MLEADIEREILAIQDSYLCEGSNDCNNDYNSNNSTSNKDDLKLESITENNQIDNSYSASSFNEDEEEEAEPDDDFLDSPSGNSAFRLSHRGPGTLSRMEDSPGSKGGRYAVSYCR